MRRLPVCRRFLAAMMVAIRAETFDDESLLFSCFLLIFLLLRLLIESSLFPISCCTKAEWEAAATCSAAAHSQGVFLVLGILG